MQRTTKPYQCHPWRWMLPVFVFLCCDKSLAINIDVAFADVSSDSKIVLVNAKDLTKIDVSVQVGDDYTGYVQIKVAESGRDKIKLWADKEKTQSLLPADTWEWTVQIVNGSLQPVDPVIFWVEGIKESATTDDVVIKATLSNGDVDEVKLTLLPVEFDFIDPDSDDWSEKLSSKKVILNDKNTRVRLRVNGLSESSWIKLSEMGLTNFKLTVPGFLPGFVEVSGPGPYFSLHVEGGNTEIRMEVTNLELISLGLTENENASDGIPEWASADVFAESASGNESDSKEFEALCESEGARSRGYATDEDKIPQPEVYPPQLYTSKTFMQAGGAMLMKAEVPELNLEAQGLIANQSDTFYYSGHAVSCGIDGHGYFETTPDVTTFGDLNNYWSDGDMKLLILSACSLLNINNWVANKLDSLPMTGPFAGYSPGNDLESFMSAQFAVGYGGLGPGDGDGDTARIIKEFMQTRAGLGVFAAWRMANSSSLLGLHGGAWNATAIQKGVKYGYFKKTINLGIEFHQWTEIPKHAW